MMPPSKEPDDEVVTALAKRFRPDAPPDARFVLTVSRGPDRGASLILDGTLPTPIFVGQGPSCALRLMDPRASRRHLSLEPSGESLRLTDLQSTNGTHVNGVTVFEALVRGGETIEIGETVIEVRCEGKAQPNPLGDSTRFGKLIGASLEMRRLYPLAERLARAPIPILIEGETGTGKEVLAEALHEASPCASGPWIVFDCTAIPDNLLEAELFGYERGAFTGAVVARKGLFEQAHGGTLFIDEIGDLALPLQAKLLRAIERSEVRPIGSDKSIKLQVRIMAATRRNLDHEVSEGRFRDDLFHRLVVGRIELPPLRKRRSDIELLARRFWEELGGATNGLSRELLSRWEDDPWHGNVRELRNAVARHLAVGDLYASALPSPEVSGASASPASPDVIAEVIAMGLPLSVARMRVVAAFEQVYIERVLREHGGNVTQAAEASGVARRYFQILRSRRK